MKIVCNGEHREVSADMRVVDLLRQLGLDPATVVVVCDDEILKQEEYESRQLREGSVLELIRFVGGG